MATPQLPRERMNPLALIVLAANQLIIAIDYNIVYVALPSLASGLHFNSGSVQWVVSAYALAFGGFLLLGGRAADLLARRAVLLTALGLYAAGSLLGGLAPSQPLLIAARVVQGLGGALLFPVTLALINAIFPEGAARNRALTVWSGAGAAGGAIGALLGGLLTSSLGWRSTFFVVVPFALAVGLLALPALADTRKHTRTSPRRASRAWSQYDIPGSATATLGSLSLVFALVEGPQQGWPSPVTLAAFVIAALSLALFLRIEARAAHPLMPLTMFRNRNLTTGALLTGVHFAGFGGQFFLVTTWLQGVHGFTAVQAGLAFVPLSLAIVAGTNLGGRLVARIGAQRTAFAGLIAGTAAMGALALLLRADQAYVTVLLPLSLLSGLGMGTAWTAQWVIASTGVPAEQQGVASGVASTSQQVGGSIGLAVLIAVSAAVTHGVAAPAQAEVITTGLRWAFASAALLLAGGAVIALIAFRRPVGSTFASAAPSAVTPAATPAPVVAAGADEGDVGSASAR